MAKPILYYQVRQQVNRSTGATILVPAIVECRWHTFLHFRGQCGNSKGG